jgi:N-acetylmuramic acid 6-phosphate (MurNAc-6-P) etherase
MVSGSPPCPREDRESPSTTVSCASGSRTDLRASNSKLIARAERLTMLATGCTIDVARETLAQCGWHIKTAIVAIERQVDVAAADALLDAADGDTWAALDAPPRP